MIDAIKRALGHCTPAMHAARELAEAELALMKSYSAREQADGLILYNEATIKRQRKYLEQYAKNNKGEQA